MAGYHIREIPKGIHGQASKVEEEFEEFIDALEQDCIVMAFVELSDILNAIEAAYYWDNPDSFNYLIKIIVDRKSPSRSEKYFKSMEDEHGHISKYFEYLWYSSIEKIEIITFLYIVDDYLRMFNMTLLDIKRMSDITKRAFESGDRK